MPGVGSDPFPSTYTTQRIPAVPTAAVVGILRTQRTILQLHYGCIPPPYIHAGRFTTRSRMPLNATRLYGLLQCYCWLFILPARPTLPSLRWPLPYCHSHTHRTRSVPLPALRAAGTTVPRCALERSFTGGVVPRAFCHALVRFTLLNYRTQVTFTYRLVRLAFYFRRYLHRTHDDFTHTLLPALYALRCTARTARAFARCCFAGARWFGERFRRPTRLPAARRSSAADVLYLPYLFAPLPRPRCIPPPPHYVALYLPLCPIPADGYTRHACGAAFCLCCYAFLLASYHLRVIYWFTTGFPLPTRTLLPLRSHPPDLTRCRTCCFHRFTMTSPAGSGSTYLLLLILSVLVVQFGGVSAAFYVFTFCGDAILRLRNAVPHHAQRCCFQHALLFLPLTRPPYFRHALIPHLCLRATLLTLPFPGGAVRPVRHRIDAFHFPVGRYSARCTLAFDLHVACPAAFAFGWHIRYAIPHPPAWRLAHYPSYPTACLPLPPTALPAGAFPTRCVVTALPLPKRSTTIPFHWMVFFACRLLPHFSSSHFGWTLLQFFNTVGCVYDIIPSRPVAGAYSFLVVMVPACLYCLTYYTCGSARILILLWMGTWHVYLALPRASLILFIITMPHLPPVAG